ncbi:unnamed protein product [Cuscuta europaea]|uniref:Uncharacterized protein n=1 Tax=Cuscuta europaea TaxID=41803 RepID=A0A9P1EKU9_CUSEU|nr:unnamed protein product [Cuscuta europaea]
MYRISPPAAHCPSSSRRPPSSRTHRPAAHPLFVTSPSWNDLKDVADNIKLCLNSNRKKGEAREAEKTPMTAFKKWQHPTALVSFDLALFVKFVTTCR